MIVARRTAPVDARCRLAGDEAAVLPEIFARPGAAAAVQAVDHGRGDAARFEDEPRHARGELSAFAGGRPNRFILGVAEPRLGHLRLSDARFQPPNYIRNSLAFRTGG